MRSFCLLVTSDINDNLTNMFRDHADKQSPIAIRFDEDILSYMSQQDD